MVRILWAILSGVRAAGHSPLSSVGGATGEGQLPWKCEPCRLCATVLCSDLVPSCLPLTRTEESNPQTPALFSLLVLAGIMCFPPFNPWPILVRAVDLQGALHALFSIDNTTVNCRRKIEFCAYVCTGWGRGGAWLPSQEAPLLGRAAHECILQEGAQPSLGDSTTSS